MHNFRAFPIISVRVLQVLGAILMTASIAVAQEVNVSHGDLYFRATATAPWRRITTTGRVKRASLSPDKNSIAFVKDTPGDSVETGLDKVSADEIWIIGVD